MSEMLPSNKGTVLVPNKCYVCLAEAPRGEKVVHKPTCIYLKPYQPVRKKTAKDKYKEMQRFVQTFGRATRQGIPQDRLCPHGLVDGVNCLVCDTDGAAEAQGYKP